MTSNPPPPPLVILFSEKLITITNLNNLIPVKLDIDEMNYLSRVYFFKSLCRGYGLLDHILGTNEATTSASPPFDTEWMKIHTIILS